MIIFQVNIEGQRVNRVTQKKVKATKLFNPCSFIMFELLNFHFLIEELMKYEDEYNKV